MRRETRFFDSVDEGVAFVLDRLREHIVCATPLGLGKPVALLNALYARVRADSKRRLTLVTALSLAVPRAASELERRFLEPFARRVFEGVPELDYLNDLTSGSLPENVEVLEFYFRPGSMLAVPQAQQHYICANYTHVARDVVRRGCNAILVMVAERGGRYSLSCNPDLTLDVVRMLRARQRDCLVVAMVNRQLPFMPNDAEVGPEFFDAVVDAAEGETRLFGVPNTPATAADHAIGLYAAALVRDGGTLQLGIGSLGDAVAHWLRARQREPEQLRLFAEALGLSRYAGLIDAEGGLGAFKQGLFAASEMFTWGLMVLYDAGLLKRRVYENENLQVALNEGVIEEALPPDALERLHAAGLIGNPLTAMNAEWLAYFGVLAEAAEAGTSLHAIPATARGKRLRHGQVLHGAFFLGPEDFYQALRELPEDERRQFNMTAVSKVNDLFGEETLERLQRQHARFINVCMKATVYGAAVSDAIEDGRIVSGVGGQYNFVAMAHELEDARSILCLRATRENGSGTESNIVFNYGHITIPRHLRDIVITEYGIADLRGRTDAECVAAMVEIADSRFQETLLRQAKAAGKLPPGYSMPERARSNTPQALWQRLRPLHQRGLLPVFPLGSDFDATEQRLIGALTALKKATAGWRGKLALAGRLPFVREQDRDRASLIRMGLADAHGLREQLMRRLVVLGLRLAEARLSDRGRAD